MMILWICFALLTAVVVGAIVAPLSREVGCESADEAGAFDVAVYRDQLDEIERDIERGVMEPQSAEAARAELARRIFSHTEKSEADAADVADGDMNGAPSVGVRIAPMKLVYALGGLLPLASVALYLAVGSPALPGRPFVAVEKKTVSQTDIDRLVEQVEARLRDKPLDGRGWDVVAPVYLRLGQFEDARIAYSKAVSLLGPTVGRLVGLGRSGIRASGGEVIVQSRTAFEKVLVLDPSNIEARLWLARAKEQDGDTAGAIAAFEEMLAGAPVDAKWRPLVEEQIAVLRGGPRVGDSLKNSSKKGVGPAGSGRPDAAGMSDEQRAKFVVEMVEGLAARLAKDGSDFDGWIRLVRAYAVLGREGDAKKALADARQRFGSESSKASALSALEREYNLGS